ncbi:MAG: hypothetical protein AAF668_08770 [Pseudomonadota bacterium]
MLIKDGKIERRRFGGHSEGIVYDEGEILQPELEALAEAEGQENLEQLTKVWLDDKATHKPSDYEFSHDVLGESVVLTLLGAVSGIQLERYNTRVEQFDSQQVLEVKT